MKPYYDDGKGIQIYHVDCREILPSLPKVDLGLTDPPYGIAHLMQGGFSAGWDKERQAGEVRTGWDSARAPDDLIQMAIDAGNTVIVWGGNYFDLPPSRGWLVWNKPERGFSMAEAELAWTNRDTVIRCYDAPRPNVGREHPTQKPIGLMIWCIEWSKTTGTILDPFMGSGTTLVAAKQLNRKAVGIEIEEKYCEIAAKRLENTTPSLFSEAI